MISPGDREKMREQAEDVLTDSLQLNSTARKMANYVNTLLDGLEAQERAAKYVVGARVRVEANGVIVGYEYDPVGGSSLDVLLDAGGDTISLDPGLVRLR